VIAVQLYTLRSLLQDPARIDDVLRRVREIGYRAVEVAGLPVAGVARFGDELRSAGLVACAAHAGLERLRTNLDGVAAECRAWGCEYVVVPSLPEEYRSRDGYVRFAAESAELAKRLRPHGLALVYHNHAFELERYGDATGLQLLFGDGALLAEPDTYWLQLGGVDPAGWIRGLAGRAPLVHLKDLAIVRDGPVDAEVGEGNLDWPEILAACRSAGTRWLVVEQDAPRGDPLESVATSHANLTELLSAMGWEG
jgi:sugar phosphate isomerase/epimerase